MSPVRVLAVALALSVTGTTGAPAADRRPGFCALQTDTAAKRLQLSALTELFGESFTTEFNGNIYIVSICNSITNLFYDPEQLVGAAKSTADGHSVVLGRIDRSDIIVNENDIVLTYTGGDVDINLKDKSKGTRWNTYIVFVCDPFTTDDILTVIDEDADQPEICQVWFEIRTKKTCDRHPYKSLNEVKKDLFIKKEQIRRKEDIKIKTNNLHGIPSERKLFNNNSELGVKNNFIKTKPDENESNQTHSQNTIFEHRSVISTTPEFITKNKYKIIEKKENSNQNVPEGKFLDHQYKLQNIHSKINYSNMNSRNIHPEAGPFIDIKHSSIDENKPVNSREKRDSLNPYLSSDRRSFNDRKNNVDENESIRERVENGNSISGKPKDRSVSENGRRDNSRNPESENEKRWNNENGNAGREREFTNDEASSNRFVPKDQWSERELSSNVTDIENDSKNNFSKTAKSGKENDSSRGKSAADDERDLPHGNSEGKRSDNANDNSADGNRSGVGNNTNGWAGAGKRSDSRTNDSDEHSTVDGQRNASNSANAQNSETAHGNSDAGKGGAETEKSKSTDSPAGKNNNSAGNSNDRVKEPSERNANENDGRNDVDGTKNSNDIGNSSATVNDVRAVTVGPGNNGHSSASPATSDHELSTTSPAKSDNGHSTISPAKSDNGHSSVSPVTSDHGLSTISPATSDNGHSTTSSPTTSPTTSDHGQSSLSPVTSDKGHSAISPATSDNGNSTTSPTTSDNGQSLISPATSPTTSDNGQSTISPATSDNGHSTTSSPTTSPTTSDHGQSSISPVTSDKGHSAISPATSDNGNSTTSPTTSDNGQSLISPATSPTTSDNGQSTTSSTTSDNGQSLISPATSPTTSDNGHSTISPAAAADIYPNHSGETSNEESTTIGGNAAGNAAITAQESSSDTPQLSGATGLQALGVLLVIYLLVGTAVNRFYFKKTGTDQIPLKGCFQSVWKSIKYCACCCRGEPTEAAANETTPLLRPKRGAESAADGTDSGQTTGKDQYGSVDEKRMEKREAKDVSSAGESGPEKTEGLIGKLFKTTIVPAYKRVVTKIGGDSETAKPEAGDDGNRKQSLTDIERGVEKAIKSLEETVSTVCGDGPEAAESGGDTKATEKPAVDGASSPPERQADDDGPAATGNKRKFDLKSVTAGLFNDAGKSSPKKTNVLDEAHDKFNSLFEFVKPSAVKTDGPKTEVATAPAVAVKEQSPRPERDEDGDGDGDDDQIEVIEEVVFVDGTGAEGEEDEIIEEIIEETTTAGATPDEQPTVTVTTTMRKISSSAGLNGEDKAKKKHSFGLKLGSSKSSANISAADKSPKKSGGSMSRLFKRSVSQPVETAADAPGPSMPNAAASSATIPRKSSRGSAGLLIFGKSRSKSTSSLEADDLPDVVTDVNVLSAFIDGERQDREQSEDAESGSPSPQENNGGQAPEAATGHDKRRVGDLLMSATTRLGKKKSDGKKAAKKTKK